MLGQPGNLAGIFGSLAVAEARNLRPDPYEQTDITSSTWVINLIFRCRCKRLWRIFLKIFVESPPR
jgi:hypothetical protein